MQILLSCLANEVPVAEIKKLKKPKLTTISSRSNKDKVPVAEMKKLKKPKLITISSCSNKDKGVNSKEPTIYTSSYVTDKVTDGSIIDIGSVVNKKLDLP
ncbi:hypothetical protein Tco_0505609 [Tanacetum coccineum]